MSYQIKIGDRVGEKVGEGSIAVTGRVVGFTDSGHLNVYWSDLDETLIAFFTDLKPVNRISWTGEER